MARINPPGYTQLPNVVLDNMGDMGEAELRIVLAVCRKTFGWQKRVDQLSLTQLMQLTGLSRPAVISGTEAAIKNGWIKRKAKGNSFEYHLLVKELYQEENEGSKEGLPKMVKKVYQNAPEMVKELYTQKKGIKEKRKGGDAPAFLETLETELSMNLNGDSQYIADGLSRYNPTPEAARAFAKWWHTSHDFGKRGQPPSPKQIVQFWPQAAKANAAPTKLKGIRNDD